MSPARLEHAPNAELMTAFSREANNKLREFAPQNISNMLWAYATLGHSPGMHLWLSAIVLLLCCGQLQRGSATCFLASSKWQPW